MQTISSWKKYIPLVQVGGRWTAGLMTMLCPLCPMANVSCVRVHCAAMTGVRVICAMFGVRIHMAAWLWLL